MQGHYKPIRGKLQYPRSTLLHRKIHEQQEKQGKKVSQTNLDAILIDSNDSMVEEMSEKKFRIYIIKMIHKAKDEIREQMQALKDNSNKWSKEQMQEAKDHFSKEIEILKTNRNP